MPASAGCFVIIPREVRAGSAQGTVSGAGASSELLLRLESDKARLCACELRLAHVLLEVPTAPPWAGVLAMSTLLTLWATAAPTAWLYPRKLVSV